MRRFLAPARRAPRAEPRACDRTGKVGYGYADAEDVARRARRRTGERVTAYRCRHGCGLWHIGTLAGREIPGRAA